MHTTTVQAFAELKQILEARYSLPAVVNSFMEKFAQQLPTHKPWQFATCDGIYRFVRADTQEVREFRIDGPKVIGL